MCEILSGFECLILISAKKYDERGYVMQQREITLQEATFQMRHRQRPRAQVK